SIFTGNDETTRQRSLFEKISLLEMTGRQPRKVSISVFCLLELDIAGEAVRLM
ncbi:13262_t:CDS:1, partial [Racocetra persica]